MLDINLGAILYAKAITLLATVAMVLAWLTYYCYRLKQKRVNLGNVSCSLYCILNMYYRVDKQ